jgi:hypothetical protein
MLNDEDAFIWDNCKMRWNYEHSRLVLLSSVVFCFFKMGWGVPPCPFVLFFFFICVMDLCICSKKKKKNPNFRGTFEV